MKREDFYINSLTLPTEYSKLTPYTRKLVRERYIELQNGKCWFCNSTLNSPPPQSILDNPVDVSLYPIGFFTRPIHLQHNHDTDLTEGAVHAYCNAVLWEYEGR